MPSRKNPRSAAKRSKSESTIAPRDGSWSPKKRKIDVDLPEKPNLVVSAVFSDSDVAASRRSTIPNDAITLTQVRNGEITRPVRVYADGIYDMFHSGHARQLMQCKQALPNVYLIVGVCNDELTLKNKGRTVMKEAERYEMVRHCRYVDEVLQNAPWQTDEEFLTKYKIDFIAHDDIPYNAAGTQDVYYQLKQQDRFLATQRTEGISTTDVIARIIYDYDEYIRRNLSRGYLPGQLNISFMKAKEIQLKGKVSEFLKKKGSALLEDWESKSKVFVRNFVDLFDSSGRWTNWLSRGKRGSLALKQSVSENDLATTSSALSPPKSPEETSRRLASPEEQEERMKDFFEGLPIGGRGGKDWVPPETV